MGYINEFTRYCLPSGHRMGIALLCSMFSLGCNKVGFQLTQGSVQQVDALCGKNDDLSAPGPKITAPTTDQLVHREIVLEGTCEGTTDVTISGGGLASPLTTACVDGKFSQSLTLNAGDGIKDLLVSQPTFNAQSGRCVIVDTTPPRVVITTPLRTQINTNTVSVVGDCETGLPIELTQTGAPSLIVACNNGSFSARFPSTSGDGVKNIVATQTDVVGNIGRDDQDFLVDTHPPTVTIVTPQANAIVRQSFPVTGTCEIGLPVHISGTAVQTLIDTTCNPGGQYSAVVDVSNRDGVFYVTAEQVDGAGNRGWDQRNVIRDMTPPAIAIRTPAPNTVASSGLPITGSCTNGIPVEISGDGVSAPFTTTCGVGSFNAVITFSAGDGNKTVIAAQTDTAGNRGQDSRTFVRDSTPPNIHITAPAVGFITRSTIPLVGTCEGGLPVQISGDTDPATVACTNGTFTHTAILKGPDGVKTIMASQTDVIGNIGRNSRTFALDTTAPVITISSPTAGTSTQSSLIIAGHCTDGLAIDVTGDLTSPKSALCANGQFSFSAVFTNGDGSKDVRVAQTDSAGNRGQDSRSFIRDTAPPDIRITGPAAGTAARVGVTVIGTCTNGYPVQLSGDISSTPAVTCTNGQFSSPVTFTTVDGNKNVVASQIDEVGNTGSDSRMFVRLTVGPAILITAPSVGTVTRSTIQLSGTCTDGFAVELSGAIETSISTSCTSRTFSASVTLTAPDGNKTVTASQTDSIGNVGSDSRVFELKTSAPGIHITGPAASSLTRGPLALIGTCTNDLPIHIEGEFTGPTSAACTNSQFSTNLTLQTPDGSKTIRVSQTDTVGNTGSDSRNFTLDTTAPVIKIASPAAGTLTKGDITATGTCETDLMVTLGGAGLVTAQQTACTNGQFTASLILSRGDGEKLVTASQTDAAGNIGSDSRTFIKDTTAPVITIESPAASTSTRGDLALSGRCTDGFPIELLGAISPSVSVCVNGVWSSTVTLLPPDGTKNVIARQTDTIGNIGTASRDFVLKTSAPAIQITAPAANYITSGGFALTGTCTTGLNVVVSDAVQGTTTCTSGTFSYTVQLSGADGVKSITVTQTDEIGNSGSSSRNFILDRTPPLVKFTAPAAGTIASSGIPITGTCETGLPVQLSGSGIGTPGPVSCTNGTFSATISFSLGDGVKAIIASQTDVAGNTGSDSRSFVRDTTAPNIKITTPLAGATTNLGLTLVGTCEDGLPVTIGGAGLSQPQTTNCSSGAFSEAVTFTAPDGAKNLTVSQTDTAGNTGSDNRSFILDATPPRVVIQSPANGTKLGGAFTLTGLCEGGLALNISGDITSPYIGVCPQSGSFAVGLSVAAGVGAKKVIASQTDSAGNSASDQANYTVTPKPTATETFLADQGEGKVDILFVDDNSASMDPEQAALGQRFPSFVEELQGLDWQVGITTTDCSTGKWGICGSLLNMTGTSSYVLNTSVVGYDQVFNNTIQRPETLNCAARGECPSGLEEALKASISAIDKRAAQNAGFFRDSAALAIVVLTDEDEQSNGPASATKPQMVVDKVVSAFGANKKFKSYAITVLSGDASCLKQQQDQQGGIGAYGTFAMNLATLTGGKAVSICAPDYSVTLKQIGQDLRKLTQAVKLSRSPTPGTIQVVFTPAQNITWTVSGDTILFDRPVAAGTKIDVSYEY